MENALDNPGTVKELIRAGFVWYLWQQSPTALDIIDQMPVGTKLQTLLDTKGNKIWECVFDINSNGYYADARQDPCPHKAAAIAFIAWKKGLE